VALRVLKKKMQCGGTFRAMKRERAYKNHRSAGRARCPRLSEVTARCCANGSDTKAIDRLSVDSSTTSELPAAYYQRLAARARRLAEESTTPAIKGRLRAAALEYERLAQRVESEASSNEC
jgi:hypothetical protein